MTNEGLFGFLIQLWIKVQAFVVRPRVQIQVMAITAILLGIGFVSGVVLVAVDKRFRRLLQDDLPKEEGEVVETVEASQSRTQLIQRVFSTGISLLLFPLLALITTNIVIFILLSQRQATGLLGLLGFILLVLLIYRLFLLILYISFPKEKVRRFQSRLFSPLFALFVLYQIMQLFTNVSVLSTVGLFNDLLESPITLGALFFATVGLYFWIDSILGLKELIFDALSHFTSFNPGRLEASLTLGGYVLIVAGLAIALNLLGISGTSFAAILGGLSVGIGFGMKEVLSNFISGILLLFEGAIRPGDQVEIAGAVVTIKKLGIRATLVESPDFIEMIVPNQDLLTKTVISYTTSHPIVRVRLPITSDHDNDPEEITRILEEAAGQCSRVLPDRKIRAFVRGIGVDGINYELRVWIDVTKNSPGAVKNEVYRAIAKALVKHNIDVNPDPDLDNFLNVASSFLQKRGA